MQVTRVIISMMPLKRNGLVSVIKNSVSVMKKFNSFFALSAAIVALSACVKEESAPVFEEKTIHFYANSIETKTAFGTPDEGVYPTLWTDNDSKIKISLNYKSPIDATVTPSADFKTASFTASVEDDNTGDYTFYAMSPASAYLGSSDQNKYLSVTIPSNQTPTATSVDEAAQILVAKSSKTDVLPDEVAFDFSHMTAYGKLTLGNLNLGDAEVSSISLTSSVPFAGRWYYYYETETAGVNSASETININTSSVSDVWFACAPVEMSGATLTVVVNTDKGTFTKEVNVPENTSFKPGVISVINVNMQGVELVSPKVYELVKDVASLLPDSQVIIVGDGYAIGTTQNSNNRAAAAITKYDDATIKDPGSDVQVLTLSPCFVKGTYSLYTGSGYLYASSSSSNQLKTETNLSLNSTWDIDVTAQGVATIVAQGSNTRNYIRHNNSNNNNLFACYATGSTTGKDVSLYKLKGSGKVQSNYVMVSDSSIEIESEAKKATLQIFSDIPWSITTEDQGVTVSPASGSGDVGDVTVTINVPENSTTQEVVYTLNVNYSETSSVVTINQAAVPLVPKDNISSLYDGSITATAEADAQKFSINVTDAIVTYINGSNAYIQDATGGTLIYKSSHGLKMGDKLNGNLTGTAYKRNGALQIISFDLTNVTKTTGATVPVTELSIADLLNNYERYYCVRVKISGATVTDAVSGTDRSGIVTKDEKEIALYAGAKNTVTFDEDAVVDFVGYPSYYNATKQIYVWENPTVNQ